jgi:GT2 family glycosyltransferase
MTPALDVIIVTYQTKDDVLRCLRSLFANPPATLRDVVVVDNASTDGTVPAVVATWPAVRVLALDTNVGFAAANNRGIAMTSSPLVLLLNGDTIVGPGALDRLVERLVATDATAAGPRLVDERGRPEVSFGPDLSPMRELVQRWRVGLAQGSSSAARAYVHRLVGREREVDWVSGACLLVRRDAAVAAGLLDERYFMYEEDVDFCVALRRRGGRVLFTPSAEITHLRGRSARSAPAATRAHYDRSHLAFYEKHRPGWAPLLRWWLRIHGRK